MSDLMTFPDTVEEFMEQYKVTDTEQVYSNGVEYVPIFRMKQWFEHLPAAEPTEEQVKEYCRRRNLALIAGEDIETMRRLFLPAEPRKWIPVAAELPEEGQMVLVTAKTQKGINSINRAYQSGGFWHGSGSMANVTAWMPLPKPYEEESDGS